MHKVQGVVARGKGQPVTLETVHVPDPAPVRCWSRFRRAGCATDLHYREGGINDDFPFLLGHEAAGLVESVGDGVTDVEPGDFVVLNWRAVCGDCRACRRGEPWYCFDTHNATQKMTLADGTEPPRLWGGAFIEKTLVAAGNARRSIRPHDPRRWACGLRRYGWARGGDQHRRCGPWDVSGGDRLWRSGHVRCRWFRARARARSSPSTSTIANSSGPATWGHGRHQQHRRRSCGSHPGLTNGFGADVVIDAVGHPETWKQAFYARDLAGTVVLVGVPTPEMHPRHPTDRRLRPWWRAEVQLVRRLSALSRFPDAGRPLPTGSALTLTRSCPRRSASAMSKPPSRRCTAATCCARW